MTPTVVVFWVFLATVVAPFFVGGFLRGYPAGPVYWLYRAVIAWRRWGYVIVRDEGRVWLFNRRSEVAYSMSVDGYGNVQAHDVYGHRVTWASIPHGLYVEMTREEERSVKVAGIRAALKREGTNEPGQLSLVEDS